MNTQALRGYTRRVRGSLAQARLALQVNIGFGDVIMRGQRWHELQRQVGTGCDGPTRLVDAGEELRRFLGPVCDSLIEESPFTQAWPRGGPWRPGIQAPMEGEGQ